MIDELILNHTLILYIYLGILSLAVGSLLNVIIYRLPLMLKADWKVECRNLLHLPQNPKKKFNLFFPRSFCPKCKQLIPFWHNIPLLSYCLLRGRCNNCSVSIPFRYPLVELLSLGLSLLAAIHFGFTMVLIFALLYIWILIALCFIDLHHQLLPDNLSLTLLWIGLIANTQSLFTPLPIAVLSAVVGYLFLWLFIKLFYLLTGKIGMGNGDFKLFAAFGAWFGWTQLPLILMIASFVGSIIGIIFLKVTGKTRGTTIAFGPFLCLAGLVSLFYGHTIISWYLGFYH